MLIYRLKFWHFCGNCVPLFLAIVGVNYQPIKWEDESLTLTPLLQSKMECTPIWVFLWLCKDCWNLKKSRSLPPNRFISSTSVWTSILSTLGEFIFLYHEMNSTQSSSAQWMVWPNQKGVDGTKKGARGGMYRLAPLGEDTKRIYYSGRSNVLII